MKIRIVFESMGGDGLRYVTVVGDDGQPIDSGLIGEWTADGDVEALCLDVLPPLDKVTLTVVEPTGKKLPEPLYSAHDRSRYIESNLWPVVVRSVTTAKGDGRMSMTLGGPVAWCDSKEQAEQLASILNEAIKPDPNEPE